MNTNRARTDVLIAGAGPAGMALAAELKRLGISAQLIDRNAKPAQNSRACVIHARTLEILEPLGVTRELLEGGVKVPIFRVRDRDHSLVTIDFSMIDSAYPFTLMYPQDRTERVLLSALDHLGVHVQRSAELLSFSADQECVAATISSNGEQQVIEAQWLIGCDGLHSRVREQSDITFEGGTYEQGFVLADLQMDWPLSRSEVSLFYSPQGLVVVAPLPNDHFRIVAMDASAPEIPSKDYIQALLDARGPRTDPARVKHITWSSRFRIHHRVAGQLRKGRILLCGDAAHVHSPAGGQGMNTGIQDAMSLAPKLASVLRGSDDSLLDEWAATRRRIAVDVVSMTDQMTRMATVTSPLAQALRNAAVALFGHVPPLRAAAARRLAELDAR